MQIVDPPIRAPKVRVSNKWKEIVSSLQNKHPGEWALIGTYTRSVATHIRKGRYPAFYPSDVEYPIDYMKDHWSVHADHLPDGNCDLYLKWDGQGCICVSCK